MEAPQADVTERALLGAAALRHYYFRNPWDLQLAVEIIVLAVASSLAANASALPDQASSERGQVIAAAIMVAAFIGNGLAARLAVAGRSRPILTGGAPLNRPRRNALAQTHVARRITKTQGPCPLSGASMTFRAYRSARHGVWRLQSFARRVRFRASPCHALVTGRRLAACLGDLPQRGAGAEAFTLRTGRWCCTRYRSSSRRSTEPIRGRSSRQSTCRDEFGRAGWQSDPQTSARTTVWLRRDYSDTAPNPGLGAT